MESQSNWAIAEDECVHCKLKDFEIGFGARTLILCDCCRARGAHKGCEEGAKATELSEANLESLQWFCSEVLLEDHM